MEKHFLRTTYFVAFLSFLFLSATQASAQYNAVVAKDGTGDYTTIQAALNAAPAGRTTPWVIYIKNGKYREKDTVAASKPFITLVGESVSNVVISWDDYSGKAIPGGGTHGTASSATFFVLANDFTAVNVTFENTTGEQPQALAINVTGDRAAFKNCRFLGGQDTVFSGGNGARHYYRNCYIDGTVDFIFGDARAVFDSCYIYPKTRSAAGSSYITAANTKQTEPYGYVFRNSKLLMNRGTTTYFFGRPWQNDAGTPDASKSRNKTVFLNTTIGNGVVRPEGWSTWDAGTNTGYITYAENKSRHFNGVPVDITQRVPWSQQLSDADAANYYNNSNLFNTWDPCSAYAGFCTDNPPELAVSNFKGVRGASTTSFTWNLSWPVAGVLLEVLKSNDKVNFTPVNNQTSPNDTAVNFGYSEPVPPPGVTYYYLIRSSKAGYATTLSHDTVTVSSTPTVTVSGTLGNFLQGVGTPSAAQSYVVSASSLTNNLIITAPAGYELSTNASTWNTNANPIVLAQDANGNIANTTIYVRLNASTAGTYSGNIIHTSQGADPVALTVNGTVQNEPLTVSEILQWHPMTVNPSDSAAVRSVGVTGSVPTLSIFSESNGVQYDGTPLPAYSAAHGQALSGAPGGTGDWRTASGGPGGNLSRVHYEQFTVTAAAGYTVRVDSLVLNNSFYLTSSNTRLAVQYSLSNFVTDSAEITGGTSGGSSVTFASNGGFTKAVAAPQDNNGTTTDFRFALNGTTGITVNTGQTLTVRLYFSCGSTSRNRYAKIKDLQFKGLSTKNPVAGDFRSYQTGVWTDLNTWERYDGTAWVRPAPEFAHYSNATGPQIMNGHIVTLAANFTEGFGYIPRRTQINAGGQLIVNTGTNLNLANDGSTPAAATTDLLINGTLTVNGGIFTNGNVFIQVNGSFINNSTGMNLSNTGDSVAVGTNGVWEQKNNSSTTPTRLSFEPASLLRVTGLTTAQTGLFKSNVRYGNVVWNNAGESAYYAVRTTLDNSNVSGSFTVQSTGTAFLTLNQASGRKVFPGGYYQTGGTVNVRESATGTDTLDVGSDFSVTGGTFNSNEGAGSSLLIRLNGFNRTLAYSQNTATNTAWLVNGGYSLSGNLSIPSAGFGLTVAGTLNLGTSVIGGAGYFTVSSGGIVTTASPTGLDGNLANTGARTFDAASSYTFNGSAAQITGSLFPSAVSGLTINNAAGVSLSSGVSVSGVLNLTSGKLTLGNNNLSAGSIVGATSAKYAVTDGPGLFKLLNVGTGNNVYPVGPSAASYNPVTINNAGTADNFSVNVKPVFDVNPPAAKRVDRQWNIAEDVPGGSNVTLRFSWVAADGTTGFSPTSPVFVYRYNGSSWDAAPATVTGAGTGSDPYVATASGFTAFSTFAVGNSPVLPVSFISNRAYSIGSGVQVEWTTATEDGIKSFAVEKSSDGRIFSGAGLVTAAGRAATYAWFDATPFAGDNFYRIKAVDDNGNNKYTGVMKVSVGGKLPSFVVASNPVKDGLLNMRFSGMEKGKYALRIYNTAGQQVSQQTLMMEGAALTQTIALPKLATGVYSLQLSNGKTSLTQKILIE